MVDKAMMVYLNGKMAKPISLKERGNIPKNFVDVYSYLISNGHMDIDSFAACGVINEDFERIHSIKTSDHNDNLLKGMVRVGIKPETHQYFIKAGDVIEERHRKQSNLMFIAGCTCIFKFKAKVRVSRPTFKYSKGNLERINNNPIPSMDRLAIRKLEHIRDAKKFYMGQISNYHNSDKFEYGIIGFDPGWESEQVINILNRYWKLNKPKQ